MTLALILAVVVIIAFLAIGVVFRMMGTMLLMLLAVLLVAGGIGGFKYYGFKQFMGQMAAADHRQTVATATATMEPWQSSIEAVGSLRAAKGVDISNELAGMVEEIHFHSGEDVKAGSLLVKLRAEDDIAKLQSLEAVAKLASITYERDKKQFKAEAVSKATIDNDAANLANARAQVAEQKAVVEKKFIRAPFSGHLGIRNIDVGQYLNPGTAIVTLQQLDPIYLDFNLPQQSLAQVKVGQKITAKNDTYPGRVFAGQITAINPKVDIATRNVQVRAALKNADRALLPGMYATAGIKVGEPKNFVTLPQTAITYNPYGDTVFVVHEKGDDKDGKEAVKPAGADASGKDKQLVVQQGFVTVGQTRGDQVQILKGVEEGDVIVSAGQLKLQNGMGVIIDNKVTPSNDPNPQPEDH